MNIEPDKQPLNNINHYDERELPEIREMELADLEPVYLLGERLFPADKWPSLYRTWDEYELANLFVSDGELCFVAEDDNSVIGFAMGTLIEKRRSAWTYAHLLWLGVDPAYRGSGVAKRLLDQFTETCIEEGARMMMVDTASENTGALRFFEGQGFGKAEQHVYLSRNLTGLPQYRRKRRRPTSRGE